MSACVNRNDRKQSCRAPIEVRSRINKLLCGTNKDNVFTQNTLTTFENLDWQFDRLFQGRSSVNTPRDFCPDVSCPSGRKKLISTSRCLPRRRYFT